MIPIVINNFNRLTTTKKLADDLYAMGYTNIHILDNDSTYPPLLEWYKNCPYTIYHAGHNHQQLAIYNSGYINQFKDHPWIVYTDSDIQLSEKTSFGFVEKIVYLTEKYSKPKGGLALQIDDLPNNPYALHYKEWETKYWQKELEPDVYDADIDTTFCVIKPGTPFTYSALRVGGDLTAKHVPWYVNFDKLDAEEEFYLDTALEWSTYKRFYKELKNNTL